MEAAFFVVVVNFFAVVVVLVVVVLSVAAAVVVTSACAAVIVNSKREIQVYFTHFLKFKSAVQFVAAQHFYYFIIHGLCGKYTLTLY